jgi:hypothetical protein
MPKTNDFMSRLIVSAPKNTDRHPDYRGLDRRTHGHCDQLPWCRTDCRANGHFESALDNRLGDHAEDAEHGQEQR